MNKIYEMMKPVFKFIVWLFGAAVFLIGIFGMFAAFILPIIFVFKNGFSLSHVLIGSLFWFCSEILAALAFLLGYIFIYWSREGNVDDITK